MSWQLVTFIFLASCGILSYLSSSLVKTLVQIAKYLHWREFIIAFFVMSFATSLPNLFIDFNAVLQGKPELAFGDIIGGNLVDLTLILAIAVFLGRKHLSAESSMVQRSALFTTGIAVLPLILVADGVMGRIDGLILMGAFGIYSWWIFSKSDRFKKVYHSKKITAISGFKSFVINLFKIVILLVLLLIASQGVVSSAQFFSDKLGVSLALIGILIVGIGNSFPEGYFAVVSARNEQNWLVLGDLMGSVIVCSTLVLGIISFILPFQIHNFTPFLNARIFLIAAVLMMLLFIHTGRRITKREGVYLLLTYIVFLIVEVFLAA